MAKGLRTGEVPGQEHTEVKPPVRIKRPNKTQQDWINEARIGGEQAAYIDSTTQARALEGKAADYTGPLTKYMDEETAEGVLYNESLIALSVASTMSITSLSYILEKSQLANADPVPYIPPIILPAT